MKKQRREFSNSGLTQINIMKDCPSRVNILKSKIEDHIELKKLSKRQTEVQLRTGTKIKFGFLYAKNKPKNYNGNRHLGLLHFNCDKNCGLMYQSIMCLLSVVCPSTEVSTKICKQLGVKAKYNRIRTLSLSFATNCMKDRIANQLGENKNLAGKKSF